MSVFPELTGRFPVGILHEEFEFKGAEPGILPLTLFYPAKPGVEEKEKYSFPEALFGLPLCEEETRFLKNAEIAEEEETWPVIFYNHGYRSYEMSNSILCGELASRGYIVAALGHAKESL